MTSYTRRTSVVKKLPARFELIKTEQRPRRRAHVGVVHTTRADALPRETVVRRRNVPRQQVIRNAIFQNPGRRSPPSMVFHHDTAGPCRSRRIRREVLLAHGKVNKPGGAPGPYKHTPNSKVKC